MGEEDEIMAKFVGDREDGEKASEAQAMIRSQSQGSQMAKYLVDTGNKTQLMELLMRTVFQSREEMLLFIDYCSWCGDFGIELDTATRYAAARPSVGGVGRSQLVDALTVVRSAAGNQRRNYGDGKDTKKLPD